MEWTVAYYDGQLPLRFVDAADDPHGIAWIEVRAGGHSMRLLGADTYLIDVDHFGLINEDGSRQDFSWSPDEGFVQEPDRDGTYGLVFFGVLLPDDHAREVGLLS